MVELLNICCMEYMKGLEDKAFDLAIVDPPYGIGEDGRSNHTRGKLARAADYRKFSRYDSESMGFEYFKELERISDNQILWGANHYISNHPFDSSAWIVWDKNNGGNDFADCELAWSSFDCAVRKFKYTWNGMLQENMKNKEDRIHPNQKPVALYRWLLHNYAKQGDRILDTHLGSGSSAIAAHQMDFDFIGCEIDKDYYDAACKRFKEQTLQLPLFTPTV
jgi:site-specific DNA-methyltransferase (adenine-specific)